VKKGSLLDAPGAVKQPGTAVSRFRNRRRRRHGGTSRFVAAASDLA